MNHGRRKESQRTKNEQIHRGTRMCITYRSITSARRLRLPYQTLDMCMEALFDAVRDDRLNLKGNDSLKSSIV